MSPKIKFLHTADLHLGAPVRGVASAPDSWIRKLNSAIGHSFERMISVAIGEKVDFVVIAGDVFDTTRPTYREYSLFFEGMKLLNDAKIECYLIAGNHDPYTTWQKDIALLPPNVHFLGIDKPEFCVYERDDEPMCIIGGRSYYNQTWMLKEKIEEGITRENAVLELQSQYPQAESIPFSIGIIHSGFDIDQRKAPSDPQKLIDQRMDYWACGHLHSRLVYPSENDPLIVFPGCIQGRDVKETKERGCYLVELSRSDWEENEEGSTVERLSQAEVTIEFVPTSTVVFHHFDVSIENCQTLTDIARLIQIELFNENGTIHCDDMVVKVRLVGASSMFKSLIEGETLETLRDQINAAYPSFYCDCITHCLSIYDERDIVEEKIRAYSKLENPRQITSAGGLDIAELPDDEFRKKSIAAVQDVFVKQGLEVPDQLTSCFEKYYQDAYYRSLERRDG